MNNWDRLLQPVALKVSYMKATKNDKQQGLIIIFIKIETAIALSMIKFQVRNSILSKLKVFFF